MATRGARATNEALFLLLTFLSLLSLSLSASPVKGSRSYKIASTNTSCTAQQMTVRLELDRPFRGVVYAKGFPIEKSCRAVGNDDSFVEISLSTSACGVRLVSVDEETLSYTVTLSIQMDKFLQQINDMDVTSSCAISQQDMVPVRQSHGKLTRTGRKQEDFVKSNSVRQIKSWMEIESTSEASTHMSRVSVGEQTMVLVKAFLPLGMSGKVVDCFAHDGTNETTQRLLDEEGCPLDESIMTSLERIRDEEEHSNEISWDESEESGSKASRTPKSGPKNERTRKKAGQETEDGRHDVELVPEEAGPADQETMLHVLGTIFAAFKFPDTANLHLKCTLQVCTKLCPAATCGRTDADSRTGKTLKLNKPSGEVVDRIQVFNSVEVVAPGIDNDGFTAEQEDDDVKIFSGEKTFCLSASKMAFSFAILGAIFLCGVLAALWTVMRSHGRKTSKSLDGSEQILVVRDSPLNFGTPRSTWSYS